MFLSFDVSSLIINVPVGDTLNIVRGKLSDLTLDQFTKIPESNIMQFLAVCVESNYFHVGNSFYKQNSGLAMGGVLSPILSNIFMDEFESVAIKNPLRIQQCSCDMLMRFSVIGNIVWMN